MYKRKYMKDKNDYKKVLKIQRINVSPFFYDIDPFTEEYKDNASKMMAKIRKGELEAVDLYARSHISMNTLAGLLAHLDEVKRMIRERVV